MSSGELKCPTCGYARHDDTPTGRFLCPNCHKMVVYDADKYEAWLRERTEREGESAEQKPSTVIHSLGHKYQEQTYFEFGKKVRKSSYATQPIMFTRPVEGTSELTARCLYCGQEVTILVRSLKAVARYRIKGGVLATPFLAFLFCYYFLSRSVQSGLRWGQWLGLVLVCWFFISLGLAIIGVRTAFGDDSGLVLSVLRDPQGKHYVFYKKVGVQGST